MLNSIGNGLEHLEKSLLLYLHVYAIFKSRVWLRLEQPMRVCVTLRIAFLFSLLSWFHSLFGWLRLGGWCFSSFHCYWVWTKYTKRRKGIVSWTFFYKHLSKIIDIKFKRKKTLNRNIRMVNSVKSGKENMPQMSQCRNYPWYFRNSRFYYPLNENWQG